MKKFVFFDLDGTLTDPKIGITRSIQFALEKLGFDIPPADELTWCIGPPLLQSLELLVGKEYASAALDLYRERFADVGWQENTPYPGIRETLQCLREAELPLYVATSKPLVFAQRIIAHFGMDQYFNRVFGSELDGTRTNKAELLHYALGETGPGAPSIMIGDREHDVFGALSNNMRAIGVSYGYGSMDELRNAGAEKIVDRHQDLLPLLL